MEEDDFAPAHRRKKLPLGDPGASLLKPPPLCLFVDFPEKQTKLRRCQPAQLSSAHPPLSSPIRGYMFFQTYFMDILQNTHELF